MTFNPLQERGIPLDRQLRNWRELNVMPIDPDHADPYTRCRVITMNGIEVEAIMFSHHIARHCPDLEVKRQLAQVRYIEAQQQKVVNWLLPGVASVLETTIAYEQVAVDLTAWVARMEPDPYLMQAYQFGVLEDFDHLYRYANLYEMIEHRKAEKIVDNLTEVMPGRPTYLHHRNPDRQRARAVRQVDRGADLQAARADHHVGRAADHELLHERRPHVHGADRPPALPGDRADRGGARHPLRVAGRPGRDVVGEAAQPRVQRVLPLPLLHGDRSPTPR